MTAEEAKDFVEKCDAECTSKGAECAKAPAPEEGASGD